MVEDMTVSVGEDVGVGVEDREEETGRNSVISRMRNTQKV